MSKHHLYRHYDAAGMLLYVGASKDAIEIEGDGLQNLAITARLQQV